MNESKNSPLVDAQQLHLIEHQAVSRFSSASISRDLWPGAIIGVYEIRHLLGRGGMGAVYRAFHSRLQKDVAIKLLPDTTMLTRRAVDRFELEMAAVGKLDHPHVVRALDAGEANGVSFLAMELIDGFDLAELVRGGRTLAPADACELVRQAAIGLRYAHKQGLIHRDVKPANLMLTADADGRPLVKVMDLGLALLMDAESDCPLTDQGQLMGTLEYMAPEQASSSRQVDSRADIYGLGATLFRLLSGTVPFHGERYDTPVKRLHGLCNDPAPSLASCDSDLPVSLIRLVDQMLARDPADRLKSMAEVEQVLEDFSRGHDIAKLLRTHRASVRQQASSPSGNVSTPDDTSREVEFTQLETAAIEPPKSSGRRIARIVGIVCLPVLAALVGDALVLDRTAATVQRSESPVATLSRVSSEATSPTRRDVIGDQVAELETGSEAMLAEDADLLSWSDEEEKINRIAANWVIDLGGRVSVRVLTNGKKLGVDSHDKIPQQPFRVRQIKLLQFRYITDASLVHLRGLKGLELLFVHGSSIAGNGLKHLSQSPITDLSLNGATLAEDGLTHLSAIPNLKRLTLHEARVDDQTLQHLPALQHLELISLRASGVSDRGIEPLNRLPALIDLRLADTAVSDRGFARFDRRCDLNRLNLDGCRNITDETIELLKDSDSLTHLLVSGTRVTDKGLTMIANAKNLKLLQIGRDQVSESALAAFRQSLPKCDVLIIDP